MATIGEHPLRRSVRKDLARGRHPNEAEGVRGDWSYRVGDYVNRHAAIAIAGCPGMSKGVADNSIAGTLCRVVPIAATSGIDTEHTINRGPTSTAGVVCSVSTYRNGLWKTMLLPQGYSQLNFLSVF